MPDREPRDDLDRALESWLRSERLTPDERRDIAASVAQRPAGSRPAGRLRRLRWMVPTAAALILIGVVTVREVLRDRTPPPRPIAGVPSEDRDPESPAGADRTPRPITPVAHSKPSPSAADVAAPLIGEVIDDRGLPLASGSVHEVSVGGRAIGGVGEIDATGHFMLRGAAGAVTTLLLVRGRSDRLRPALVRYGPGESRLKVTLERAEPLVGTAVDQASGADLTGVEIAIAADWPGGRFDLARTVAIDGRFELPPLPTYGAGTGGSDFLYTVRVARPGYVTRLHRFDGARALEQWLREPIRLAAAGAVSVSVRTADGRPLVGAVVQLLPAGDIAGLFTYRAPDGARTAADGMVRFERVPVGAIRVRVSHPDALAAAEDRVTVSAHGGHHLALACDIGAEIAGRATDDGGRPIAAATVFAVGAPLVQEQDERAAPHRAYGPVPSDANGTFRLRGLPAGRYAVHVYARDRDGTSFVPGRPLVRTGDRPVAVALTRSRVTLWLEVHEAATKRAVGTFAVVLLGPSGRTIGRALRQGGGRWSIAGIDPTTTAVQVLAPGYLPSRLCRLSTNASSPTSPGPGPGPIDGLDRPLGADGSRFARIGLDRAATVAGVVVDQRGRPVSGVELARTVDDVEPIRPDALALHAAGLARTTRSGPDGRFFLGGLAARVQDGDPFWLRILRPGAAPFRYDLPSLRAGQALNDLTIVVPDPRVKFTMPRVKLDLPETFGFSTEVPVRVTDVNYGGHVGNDALLGILHEARVQFFRSHGFTELDVAGVGIILTDAVLVYRAEAFHGDVLQVDVAATDPEKRGCDLYYRVRRCDDEKTHVLHAKTAMCFFDYETRRVTQMPEAFRRVFAV